MSGDGVSSDAEFIILMSSIKNDDTLKGRHVHVTGDIPFTQDEMIRLIRNCQGECRDPYTLPYWPGIVEDMDARKPHSEIPGYKYGKKYLEKLKIILIGREGFNKKFQEFSLHHLSDMKFIYLSQETFIELLRFGKAMRYYPGDPRINEHQGLHFLAQVGFTWPSTVVYYFLNRPVGDLAPVSKLRKMGYSVAAGFTIYHRQRALRNCVTRFGLEEVAGMVAWLARMRKGRSDDIMKDAIKRYEEDLAWLRRTFYDNSRFSFIWPNTYE